jgi:hypothetical protein
MVTMLHALIIHRGFTYGHYALYSSCPEGRHMVTILYTLIIHRASAYSHYALYSYYQQKVRI